MDVSFQPTRGRPFTIEVGFFDTVSEIKEKIQKEQCIPAPTQTLMFNGNILQDDLNIHDSEILDLSHIQLIVAPETNVNSNGLVIQDIQSSPTPSNKIRLIVKMPNRAKPSLELEMEAHDTVRRLKERIQETQGLPMNMLVLHINGNELRDPNKSLRDYSLSYSSEVDLSIRGGDFSPMPPPNSSTGLGPSSTSSSGSSSDTNRSKKLRVTIVTKCGTKKIPLEVNPAENVAALRKELQKLSNHAQLDLPPEGYFFIYKQNVMDDDRSIRWHQVGQGDIIEIFNGSVTGGT
ncbi:hypothetical protein Leryth_023197 [Lithospermum erythrorhizon]|nr:hypothetical protein Leryth_023197 [Lithospermum erythrorhizon]